MSSITCPKCGTENPANTVNCKQCRINLKFALENPEEIDRMKRREQESAARIQQAVVKIKLGVPPLVFWPRGCVYCCSPYAKKGYSFKVSLYAGKDGPYRLTQNWELPICDACGPPLPFEEPVRFVRVSVSLSPQAIVYKVYFASPQYALLFRLFNESLFTEIVDPGSLYVDEKLAVLLTEHILGRAHPLQDMIHRDAMQRAPHLTHVLDDFLKPMRDAMQRAALEELVSLPGDLDVKRKTCLQLLVNPALEDNLRRRAAAFLREEGDDSTIAPLVAAFDSEQEAVRANAAYALASVKRVGLLLPQRIAAVKTLITALLDPSPKVREKAAETLAEVGDDTAVEPLTLAFRNETDAHVRSAIISALVSIAGDQALETFMTEWLSSALRDESWKVRTRAVEALVKIGDDTAVEALISVLRIKDSPARRTVVEGLGKIGSEKAVEALLTIYKTDPDRELRKTAGKALGDRRPLRRWEKILGRGKKGE